MVDFNLRPKIDVFENPHGLSVFSARPKYQTDKEKELFEKAEIKRKLLEANPTPWKMYHKLPPIHENITQKFPDVHNKHSGP